MIVIVILSLLISIKSQIDEDTTYFNHPKKNENLVLMSENSTPGVVSILLFDKTGSDSQKWRFIKSGSYYLIKNSGTDFYLHYSDTTIDQAANDDSNNFKWTIEDGSSTGYYRIKSASGKCVTDDNGNLKEVIYLGDQASKSKFYDTQNWK